MQLGLVTYMWGAEWDVPTIIKNCRATGFAGVELRSGHKHGVEPTLSKAARREVAARFEDSGVTLVGLGSACEYHSPDAQGAGERTSTRQRRLSSCRTTWAAAA